MLAAWGVLFAWFLVSASSSICMLPPWTGVSIHAAQKSYLQGIHKARGKCHMAKLWK